MALLWIEGFEGFGITVDSAPTPTGVYARKYTVTTESGFRVVTGRHAGYALKFVTSTCILASGSLTTDATMVVGLAYKTVNGTSHGLLAFYDGVTMGMNLRWVSGGNLAVYRGGTQLAVTAGLGLQVNTWYYLEFKVVCNSTTGSFEVRVDSVNQLSATGQNTKAGSHDYHTAFWIQNVAGENPTYDNLYCLDGSGSVNDFLGVQHVATSYPDGAGDSAQWTPSAGANYATIDEESADDDTTYVETDTSGYLDLYTYGDLTGTGDINGVQINTQVRRTNSLVSRDFYQSAKRGTTESDGSAVTAAEDTFTTKVRIMETDPTGIAWTPTNFNGTQFGEKLV
jgi:hypothetical protein